jgi:Ricin-type beta-trefoil lectin domain
VRSLAFSLRVPVAAVLALLPVAGVTAAQAAPQPDAPAAVSRILTFANKCVDVAGRSTADGAQIQQFGCNGTPAQDFRIVPVGDNRVNIMTFAGKCVDVSGGVSSDGARIQQFHCNGTGAQEFRIVPVGGDRVNIMTFANKCVDVTGGVSDDRARIQQFHCNGTGAQDFRII